MTLKDIVARLEQIAEIHNVAHCDDCDTWVNCDDDTMHQAIDELRLDVERHILRTEGTLTP